MPTPSMLLDDQLCFALYAASRAVVGVYRPLLDELGLTYPQYLVLLVLWERHEVTIKELGTLLHLDYGTLTPMLKRLEGTGIIERRRRLDDERSVDVLLTPEGAALRERATHISPAVIAALGMRGADIRELLTALRALIGQLSPTRPA